MAFSTTCPVAGARLVSSRKVSAPRRAAVQVTDLKSLLTCWQQPYTSGKVLHLVLVATSLLGAVQYRV